MNTSKDTLIFSSLVQKFFCDRLINQQDVSGRTVSSYRDTFRLLLSFIETTEGYSPECITFEQLNANLVIAFLSHLESNRNNCVRTRNARLAAIRSFFQYAALEAPEYLLHINRVLAIPMKRFDRPPVQYLTQEEVKAIIVASDKTSWSGRRDAVMFTTLYNTGARVSELIAIHRADITISHGSASVYLHGKGRKDRTVPLWASTSRKLKQWIRELPDHPDFPVFPDSQGKSLSRSGVEFRLKKAAGNASQTCASLRGRSVSPHMFRHTTAMHMLQSGVDLSVIALWLGHESIQTTHMYMEADLRTKEAAMARIEPNTWGASNKRYKTSDKLLQFLESL